MSKIKGHAPYTPVPAYMADPRMAWARFAEGDGAGGVNPQAPAAPAEPAKPTDQGPAQDSTDWKAEARKWESRAKENSKAADELAQLKGASRSEADRIAALERRAAEAESKALRAEVANAKGVPAALLTGTTLDDLQASADALIAFRGKPSGPAVPNQERSPSQIPDSPEREAARKLFGRN